MAEWKQTLHLEGFYHSDDLSLKEKAERISAIIRLRLRNKFTEKDYDYELNEVVDEFDHFETEHGVEEFDGIMERLYDWCDVERVWVVTR